MYTHIHTHILIQTHPHTFTHIKFGLRYTILVIWLVITTLINNVLAFYHDIHN